MAYASHEMKVTNQGILSLIWNILTQKNLLMYVPIFYTDSMTDKFIFSLKMVSSIYCV